LVLLIGCFWFSKACRRNAFLIYPILFAVVGVFCLLVGPGVVKWASELDVTNDALTEYAQELAADFWRLEAILRHAYFEPLRVTD
jgi:hypothetical protein